MKPPEYHDVDPRTLRVPTQRLSGAVPWKLQRQIARYGTSQQGMPPIWVSRAPDGTFVIDDGVTRATRIAQLCPGDLVRVQVTGDLRTPVAHLPTIGDLIP